MQVYSFIIHNKNLCKSAFVMWSLHGELPCVKANVSCKNVWGNNTTQTTETGVLCVCLCTVPKQLLLEQH